MKRFHTVGFILLWLSIFVAMFAMKMVAKAIYQVPVYEPDSTNLVCRKRHRNHIESLNKRSEVILTENNKQCRVGKPQESTGYQKIDEI